MEKVTDDTLIPIDMLIPCFLGGFSIALSFSVSLLHVWLLVLLVKILRHEVEDSVDALLRVVLTITLEGHVVLTKDPLEKVWPHYLVAIFPHFRDQLGPRLHQTALGSERVLDFLFDERFVFPIEEELRELISIGEALDTRVHVAGVSEVRQTD